MLSLKGSGSFSIAPLKPSLLDLPSEIIDLVVECVYADSGNYARSIFAVSYSCRGLRQSALSILFRNVTLLIHASHLERRSRDFLKYLTTVNRDLASHTRCVGISPKLFVGTGVSEETDVETEKAIIAQAFQLFTSLVTIRLQCHSRLVVHMLKELQDRPLRILIDARDDENASGVDVNDFIADLPKQQSSWRWSFALSPFLPCRQPSLESLLNVSRINALEWTDPWTTWNLEDFLNMRFEFLRQIRLSDSLEELHISERKLRRLGTVPDSVTGMVKDTLLHLPHLRRLSVSTLDLTKIVLSVLDQLTNLEQLRLYGSHPSVFHHPCDGTPVRQETSQTQHFPWRSLPRLRHLDLRYICKHFDIKQVLPTGLCGLRLEFFGPSDRLRVPDLRWLASTSPHLERLELDIGGLRNLWRPTAVPGVDVDVEVYQILQAFTLFRKLRVIRLFPSYWEDGEMVEPLSDQQAVRLFNHIHRQLPSLQLIIISISLGEYPIFESSRVQHDIQPMKWTLRPVSDRTVLHTCHAERHYDLEQVWHGERKLRTRTVRHRNYRPYFDDLSDWDLPSCDVPRRWVFL